MCEKSVVQFQRTMQFQADLQRKETHATVSVRQELRFAPVCSLVFVNSDINNTINVSLSRRSRCSSSCRVEQRNCRAETVRQQKKKQVS
jgi:hypothetical protein